MSESPKRKARSTNSSTDAAPVSNFIRSQVEADLEAGKYAGRRWGGRPGPAEVHSGAAADPARIRTRFPPEPNGYLHFGHAKSICLNFGLARDYGGACHLRFDDTNPTKEEQEYVDAIRDAVHWLGFDWGTNEYYASDYFEHLFRFAQNLIERNLAYVDSQSADEMRGTRGTLTEPGRNSPYRNRPVEESLRLLTEMRDGKHPDGSHVLRAKIDMAAPNINLRDPVMYRIRHATHHRTGDAWCIYPTYDWAHGVSDAMENITHSLCTLEFEDHRPLYDWFNQRLAEGGMLQSPLPQQIEFARLNLTYVVLSKRKLIQLVNEGHVEGWDDPRMPTLVGARRRGYTPAGFRLFADRIGVAKADSWIDYSVLEDCMREHLNDVAPRRWAVLEPLRLIVENYPSQREETFDVPSFPNNPALGSRQVPFARELWIDRHDFSPDPPKGYFRLYVGNKVKLRYAYVVECTGYDTDSRGEVVAVRCKYIPDSHTTSSASEGTRIKGNIHWISIKHAYRGQIHLYDKLFTVPNPGVERDFLEDLNKQSKKTITAQLEPSLRDALPEEHYQLERHGYFIVDSRSFAPGCPSFNRTTQLRESWSLTGAKQQEKKPEAQAVMRSAEDWYDDEADATEEYPLHEYGLAFSASDFNTKTIFDFIESGAVIIPGFQRNYVWDQRGASKLIESLIIGLPIPQVFLYQEAPNKYLVIDGQQRLMSIYYFIKQRFPRKDKRVELRTIFAKFGRIPPEVLHDDKYFTNFALQLRTPNSKTKNRFHGLNYSTLGDDKIALDLKAIRNVIISKATPDVDDSAVYEIFNRLNTGGVNLTPQEIRASLYHSAFYEMLARMNLDLNWRKMLGLPEADLHMKDVEFLLRGLAMLLDHKNYSPSMARFLDESSRKCKDLKVEKIVYLERLYASFFQACAKLTAESFRGASGRFSPSIFEAVFVAICEPLLESDSLVTEEISQSYFDILKKDPVFARASEKRTTDTQNVEKRLSRAKNLRWHEVQ